MNPAQIEFDTKWVNLQKKDQIAKFFDRLQMYLLSASD